MKMHRVHQFTPAVRPFNDRVCMQLGFARYSATPQEAIDLAAQLVEVAEHVLREQETGDAQHR